MDSEQPERSGGILMGILKRVVPWIALIAVVALAWTYIGQYRSEVADRASSETSGTVEATGTTGAEAGTLVKVLNDGLNLRAEPSTNATVIRQLAKDQQLVLVDRASGWYQVRDADGTVGWVAAGGSYTVLIQP
jgi:SH3-like domain-containing protein